MELNQEDRTALYNVWMSQKAKMQITQMEMSKRLGLSQMEFSRILRGNAPLTMGFVTKFCQQLHVEPYNVLPTLKANYTGAEVVVHLQNRISVDGEIQNVYIEGNQVIIDYTHQA
ncbi:MULTISPECIES: helix-turn-helix domain-containing protein [Vibrio]|uniref:XRE family transcriptional regulator n=2 Tax=Vibrio TaxID=662 RepID=A0A7X4LPY9_9VIBR|nr:MULTISPECIES: helix-turn-helix transcriptional regulator [Vibrio]MBF9002796.1 helix-turn-helix transcriptional regulator [Vibrio nitrifigilis]MZI95839.1 XRE family transcriptional regulator [Vibrio eleionomae]